MSNIFLGLFRSAVKDFVGANITKHEANEMYTNLLKNVKDIENIKNIVVDDKPNTHYFHVDWVQNIFGEVYRTNGSDNSTLIIKNISKHKVLTIGDKITSSLYRFPVTILELSKESDGINQRVKVKTSRGATISLMKHSLLGL